jgi:hypothetical protein
MTPGATTVHQLTFGRLDAGGTRLRLRALHVMGHGSARISRALGVREDTIQRLVRGDARTISPPCATPSPTCTTRGGTSAPPNAPALNAPPPLAPAAAPAPGTGAPAPPWTTTSSTSPATGPAPATARPPAPASPPTSACRSAATGGKAHD